MSATASSLSGGWRPGRPVGNCALPLAALLAFAPLAAPAQPTELRDVRIPVYQGSSRELLATWRIGRLHNEHRKVGFFRVKTLPHFVAEDVRLDVLAPTAAVTALAAQPFRLPTSAGRLPVEWRRVEFSCAGDAAPRLRADVVRPLAGTNALRCELDGVVLAAAPAPIEVGRAILELDGPAPGVRWRERNLDLRWEFFSGQFTTNRIPTNN